MPSQNIPGSDARWRPESEWKNDPNFEFDLSVPDQPMGGPKPGFWTKAMPYLVAAGFAGGQIAAWMAAGQAGITAATATGAIPPGTAGAAAGTAGVSAGMETGVTGLGIGAGVIGDKLSGFDPIPPSGYDSAGKLLAKTVPGAADRLGIGDESDGNGGLNPILKAAIAALTGIGPALMASRGNQPSAEENALMEQARQLQALQQKRIEYQNPLFESVSQLAMSRLPTAQQRQMKGGL